MLLSVLDVSPVVQGSTPREALRNTVDLARLADELGYHRYWVPEHHSMRGVASSAPAVLIGQLANATKRIRVGAGGVLLPNHSPLVVAEQFGTLEALHPGRIDLGLGRAPGGHSAAAAAVRSEAERTAKTFPEQLDELQGYLDPPADARVKAIPALGGNTPALWILGSSSSSAELAADRGLPYAYAHHLNPAGTVDAARSYRERFRPSKHTAVPNLLISVTAIAAEDDARADWLAGPHRLKVLNRLQGNRILLPTPEEAAAHPSDELESVRILTGSPETVLTGLQQLQADTGADELMLTTPVYHHADRRRSYELLVPPRPV